MIDTQTNDLSALNTSVLFTNWTNDDFTYSWGGRKYTFPARSSTQINAGDKEHNEGLAKHFAKHLIDRELNARNVPTDHHTRKEFEENCFKPTNETETVPVLNVEIHAETGLVKTVTEVGREDVVTGKKTKGGKKEVKAETVEVPENNSKTVPKKDTKKNADEFED